MAGSASAVAGLLREPSESGGDLGLVRRGSQAIGLAIGPESPVEIALANLCRGDLAPRQVGARVLGQLEDALPGRHRRVLAVDPIQDVPEAVERCAGNRRVVEADHPLVDGARVRVLTVLEERVGTAKEIDRGRPIERSGRERR